MRHFGFKLFSSNLYNAPNLVQECADFAQKQNDMFIELMVISSSTLADFQKLKDMLGESPVRIHSMHHHEGFDAGNKDLEQQNRTLLSLSQQAADIFDSPTIIVHAGCGHDETRLQETARQFKLFNDSRILVENLPYISGPKSGYLHFHGNTPEEIKYIMDESGCGFCFDFSHGACAAYYFKRDIDECFQKFADLKPRMYHMCDGFVGQIYDTHEHFGQGNYPLAHFLKDYTAKNAYITMETGHGVMEHNTLWVQDYNYLKSLL